MSADEEKPDPCEWTERAYASALARMSWHDAPTARLTYSLADDSLVVEMVETAASFELLLGNRLLVEFDGNDRGAQPVALYLSGVRSDPNSQACEFARDLLGAGIWATVESLVATGGEQADIMLDAEEAAARTVAWRGVVQWTRDRFQVLVTDPRRKRVIGVEVLPGRVTAVLTDGGENVLDETVTTPGANDAETVVEAIADAIQRLADRHLDIDAQHCPVGLQIGGPVEPETGVVTSYDKPLHPGDDPWKAVPLGELLRVATGRRISVFNDAAALAAYEIEYGLGREVSRFAVLIVGQGIGAAFVRDGRVQDYPMEIGVFVFAPDAGLDEPVSTESASIEANSGVRRIVAAVAAECSEVVGAPITDLDSAAAAAHACSAALDQFTLAGSGLARGIAAIQAVVDPPRWVLYAPRALADEATLAGETFVAQLRGAGRYIQYHGLHPINLVSRALDYRHGALAAAVAASAR